MAATVTYLGDETEFNNCNMKVAFLSGGTEPNITATPSGNQANAYQLSAMFNWITVCATNGDSVKLPPGKHFGLEITIINDGAANAQVFGNAIDTIDGVATATGVTLSAGKRCKYVLVQTGNASTTAGKWISNMGVKSA